jgi:hypothetical protein
MELMRFFPYCPPVPLVAQHEGIAAPPILVEERRP